MMPAPPGTLIRAAALYLPLTAAAACGLVLRAGPRRLPATLLGALWTLPTLLLLQQLNNLVGHWWSFSTSGPTLRGMPVELALGWAVLWGVLPSLAFARVPLAVTGAFLAALDVLTMPLLAPVLTLGPHWLRGEAVALALVLTPSLVLARTTQSKTLLPLRAGLQVALSGLLFLYLLPELAFALRPGRGWSPLLALSSAPRQMALQLIFFVAVPGVSAVQEFATRGRGTPIPYDPPTRLVTSGIYRYTSNPMQLACTLAMIGWALLLRSGWLLLAAGISAIYSAGIAHWDERVDLRARFGAPFRDYAAAVPVWRLRWRPFHAGPSARLYVAGTCTVCSELRRFLEARHPRGLLLLPAESLPANSIRRLRYVPPEGVPAVEGVAALARALEHLHLGWAYCGFVLRLPLLDRLAQFVADAAGFGPMTIPAHCTLPVASSSAAEASTPSAYIKGSAEIEHTAASAP